MVPRQVSFDVVRGSIHLNAAILFHHSWVPTPVECVEPAIRIDGCRQARAGGQDRVSDGRRLIAATAPLMGPFSVVMLLKLLSDSFHLLQRSHMKYL